MFSSRTATSDPMKSGHPCPKCGSTGIQRFESVRAGDGPLAVGHVLAGAFAYSPSSRPSPAATAASRHSIGSDHGDESQKDIDTGCMRRSDDGEPSEAQHEG